MALHQQAYDLCFPEALADDPRIVALTATLRSLRYRQFVATIPGCGPLTRARNASSHGSPDLPPLLRKE